jgi:class 3 adenylate cyclase/tetratricopeptide (TPR) repeat protein
MAATDLVTILNTDWVTSTATRARLGEDRADVLQHLHDDLLRETIEQHDGAVVKNSGDGVIATFHSTTNALAAGIEIQQRFDAYSREAPPGEQILVRVGISAGDVVHRDDDIFGVAVIEAVRLQTVAEASQILCSDLVRALGRGRGGFEFELVGLLDLKGLPEPVAACRVLWEPASLHAVTALPLPPELSVGGSSQFVGREAELALATECVLAVEQAHVLWLLGEPGIGKTRLALEAASHAHQRGALVLYGRCDEQVRAPFQPVIDALRWFVAQHGDDELADALGVDPEPLVRLVPELVARVPGLRRPEVASETEQYRLFESVRSWLATISSRFSIVFVVDDVHWADRPTLALLGHVVRSAQPTRLTILATARDTSPDISETLNEIVDDLERTSRSRRVPLGGLTIENIASLLEGSTLPAALATRLIEETAGNPLFIRAVLGAMRADGTLPAELPTDLRAAIRRRVGRFTPATLELIQAAALYGLEFSLGVASTAVELSDRDGLLHVEEASNAGLVEEVAIDRFRFTHALVRDALIAELSASRKARMHVAIARAIEARYAARLEDHLRALAQHYANSGEPALLERALDYAKRSARHAIDMLAFTAASEDYTFALDLVTRMPAFPNRSRNELMIAKGRAQQLDGDHAAACATLRAVADLARAEEDWDAFARAAIEFEETAWRPGMFGPDALALCGEALQHDIAPVQRAWIRASLGRALHYTGLFEESRQVVEAALAEAREIDDPALLAHALVATTQSMATYRPGEPELVIERAREAKRLHDRAPDDSPYGTAAEYAAVASLRLGDREGFEYWYSEFERSSEAGGLWFGGYVALCNAQVRSFLDGNLEEAEHCANRASEFGQAREDVEGVLGLQMFLIRREQDRLGELAPVVRMLLQVNPAAAMWRPGLVLLLAEVGMHDEAREHVREMVRDGIAQVTRDILFLPSLCLLAETAYLLGDADVASAIVPELSQWPGHGVTLGGVTGYLGAVTRYRALLAWTLGDLAEADALFAEALEFERGLRAVPSTARTLVDWARLRAELGDAAGATEMAREAFEIAQRHGLEAVRRQAREIGVSDGFAADGRAEAP